MLRGVDRGVRAAGQRGRGGGRQGGDGAEGDEVVRDQGSGAAGLRDGLAVHDHIVKIGHDVRLRGVVDVGDHGDLDRVAAGAAILRGHGHSADGGAGLRAAAVHAVDQKGLRALHGFADQKDIRVGGVVAEDLQTGRVEVRGVQLEDLAFRPPVQFQGKGRDAAFPHFGVGPHAHEVDVSTRKDLVLYGERTSTNRHSYTLLSRKSVTRRTASSRV